MLFFLVSAMHVSTYRFNVTFVFDCLESWSGLQDGNVIVVQDKAATQNVTGDLPSSGYTAFPGVDVQLDITPANNSCSTNRSAPLVAQVNECASKYGWAFCCLEIDLGLDPRQVSHTKLARESLTSAYHGRARHSRQRMRDLSANQSSLRLTC